MQVAAVHPAEPSLIYGEDIRKEGLQQLIDSLACGDVIEHSLDLFVELAKAWFGEFGFFGAVRGEDRDGAARAVPSAPRRRLPWRVSGLLSERLSPVCAYGVPAPVDQEKPGGAASFVSPTGSRGRTGSTAGPAPDSGIAVLCRTRAPSTNTR